MTSTRNPLHDFILTPQQQSLLFAALNSNQPSNVLANASLNMSPVQIDGSPLQQSDGLGSFQGSPEFDYEYDFPGADSGFDFSFDDSNQPKMIGDLPGATKAPKSDSADTESPEKRSHPDDGESSGAKRRESEEKVAKKPGRKPLTTEPSSKRKAQNRAAQRAFRERKEKHLRDLENKVQELEKLSETANSENQALRAKLEKTTIELNEYKKRLSLLSSNRPAYQGPAGPFGNAIVNNLNDVNFQFEFPKFGTLPGPQATNDAKRSSSSTSSTQSPKHKTINHPSPSEKSQNGASPSNSSSHSQSGLDSQMNDEMAARSSGLFTSPFSNGNAANGSSISLDTHFNTTSSPSASSNSNTCGASSSCGTSPEPFTQSPLGFKPVDTLATIGEETPSLSNLTQDLGHFANVGANDFWLPQDFQFDPQLFGDYREPQESILSNGFDDSFFNEALDMDFITPYNLPITTSPKTNKKDLIAQIDAAKDADDAPASGQMLTCNKIWEKLQTCPKVQSGDFDLDGLCSDLQKKAKCSGSGAVVDEQDFKSVMRKYLCKVEESSAKHDSASKHTKA
ncbi:hypothetical protein VTK56DRAFT_2530 [Thermocarpiscus australiensis]